LLEDFGFKAVSPKRLNKTAKVRHKSPVAGVLILKGIMESARIIELGCHRRRVTVLRSLIRTNLSNRLSRTRLLKLTAIAFLITAITTLNGWRFDTVLAESPAEVREEFHQTYPLSANGRVSLSNVRGDIRITGWDRNEVKVDAVKRAANNNLLKETEIKVEATADSVRIWTRYANEDQRRKFQADKDEEDIAAVDYTLKVPIGAHLDSVSLVGGSLEISGFNGDLRAAAVSGKINAQGLSGATRISTISGTLEVTLKHLDEAKPLSFSSVNGSVALTIPSDSNAVLKASSLNGRIVNDFAPADTGNQTMMGHHVSAQLGKGGAPITLTSINGSITIHHAADGKPVSSVTSLVSKIQTQSIAPKVKVRRPPSEALLKARRDAEQARTELRRAERELNLEARTRTNRALSEAERNVAQARAEMDRAQSANNSDSQRAAAQALADAQRKLAEARADLQRSQAETTSAAQKQRAQALADAQRKMAQAQAELQRIQRAEMTEADRERNQAMKESQAELVRVQREMQLRIQREAREKIRTENMKPRVAVGPSLGALRFRDAESKTFNVSGKPRVTIGTFDGRIIVHAWDKNEVMYTATKRAVEETALKGISLRAEQTGSDVSIVAKMDEASVHRIAGVKSVNAYTTMEVYVPRNASIRASTGEGGMDVGGISGDLDLRNSAGSITVTNCKGRLTINAGSGRVLVTDFDGELDARSGTTGGLHLGGHFTKLTAQTNNEPIYLTIAPDTNAVIEADSASVTNEGLQVSEETGSTQRVKRFKVGKGGPLFTVKAGEGRVYLRPAGRGPM
jgi:DUF4097 and DUF4098 domain-containing protein YvlB